MRYLPLFLLLNCMAFAQTSVSDKAKKVQGKARARLVASWKLGPELIETSGLVSWNGRFWSHNDSGGKNCLYAIDTASAQIEEFKLPKTKNQDWEEIAQDSLHFYIGDFGDNLHRREFPYILRIGKQSFLDRKPIIDSIVFSWPDLPSETQTIQKTFLNCEAMMVYGDSIYLFSKEQKNRQTRLFSLPKAAGKYTAKYRDRLKTRLMITGACYDEKQNKVVLSGYNWLLQPSLLVLSDFQDTDFFGGKIHKKRLCLPFRQVESIAVNEKSEYFLTNEYFRVPWIFTTRQKLHQIKL